MFKVTNNQITLTRGDTCNFAVEIKNGEGNIHALSENETLQFTLCKGDGVTKVIQKTFNGNVLSLTSVETILDLGVYIYDVVLHTDEGNYTIISPTPFKIVGEVHTNVVL